MNTSEQGQGDTKPLKCPMIQHATHRITLVDHDLAGLHALEQFLVCQSFEVSSFSDPIQALAHISQESCDLVVTEVMLSSMSGFDLLRHLRKKCPELPVILVSGNDEFLEVLNIMKNDELVNFLAKPIQTDDLLQLMQMSLSRPALLVPSDDAFPLIVKEKHRVLIRDLKFNPMNIFVHEKIGTYFVHSKKMESIYRTLDRVLEIHDINILVEGETGTGKEAVARYLHYKSTRHLKNFVPVNCATLSENLFEAELFGYEKGSFTGADLQGKQGLLETAAEGTIFLDEIEELTTSQQSKLLRLLQENEFYRVGGTKPIRNRARIVCATNRDIQTLMAEGKFREDLYYRLNTCKVHLPPLRERKEEIIPLSIFFIRQTIEKLKLKASWIDSSALDLLTSHSWPGNVRELKNFLTGALLVSDDEVVSRETFRALETAKPCPKPQPDFQLPDFESAFNLYDHIDVIL
ncbi:MAG: sigma-54-dependent Fis family transcriptional regulator, partial [Spirochaetia bacterium]|nr:sigma-54-dependent Fis family transcriptional regulator [Spirochaetia bacterium]